MLYPRGATLGPRVRDQYELVWAQTEHFNVIVDGKEITIKGKDILFIRPGQTNFFKFSENAPTRHGFLTFRFANNLYPQQLNLYPNKLSGALSDLYGPIFDCLVDVLPVYDDCQESDFVRLGMTTALFLESCDWPVLSNPETSVVGSAPLARAIRALQDFWRDGYERPVSVSALAEKAGVTSRQLNRLFQAKFSMPTREYIKRRRLAHGAQLLERSNLSIQSVGYACGFESPFAFSRSFKKHYSATPSEFRKACIEVN